MRLQHHPELLERLAASYALGTLRGPARRRFEAMAREQPAVRAAALTWQGHLAGLNELQTGAEPAPAVWTRIDNLLRAEREQAALRAARAAPATQAAGRGSAWLRNLALWRTVAGVALVASVAAISVSLGLRTQLGTEVATLQAQLQQQQQAAAQPDYVAVLADAQSAAALLVSFNPGRSQLTLQRLGSYREADDRSLQLWALPPGGAPRSLGVLGPEPLLHLRAAENELQGIPALAISLEPKGGVPVGSGPTGPVLFQGALLRRQL